MSNEQQALSSGRFGTHSTASQGQRVLEYGQMDVFAESTLEGNMLAVFADARGLTDGEMQALARETNLSETTFILPGDPEGERERGVRVRIFTTREELPFAGHPTLGTASWIWLNHQEFRGAAEIRLDLKVGTIPVRFTVPEPGTDGVFAEMRQRDPEFLGVHDKKQVAAALGLAAEDLSEELPVQTVSTGMPFCVVPLRSLTVAARLALPQDLSEKYLKEHGAKFFYCITPAHPDSGADWHARMQFYGSEYPATGSAAGCAIAYLVRQGRAASGQRIVIEQGIEMKRPSRIHAHAILADGAVRDVYVGGRTIEVAKGRYFLPRCTRFQQDERA